MAATFSNAHYKAVVFPLWARSRVNNSFKPIKRMIKVNKIKKQREEAMPGLNSAHMCLSAAAVFSCTKTRGNRKNCGDVQQVAEVHQTSSKLTYQCTEERKQKTLKHWHKPSNRLPPIMRQNNSYSNQSSLSLSLSLCLSRSSEKKEKKKETQAMWIW